MAGEHYFSTAPESPRRDHRVELTLPRGVVSVQTASGTFSPGGVDRGTSALLRHVPSPSGDVLVDVGCGWGPLALTLADACPDAVVYAVDVNARAREVCATNASTLGLDRLQVVAPEEYPTATPIDLIWSNPPIRIGKAALHELLDTWLHRLSPTGEAWLVVAKSLGAESLLSWINQLGGGSFLATREARDKGFWILRVQRSA